jgi:hypothetical protein
MIQKVHGGVDKLIQKHGLLKFQTFDDKIEVVGGVKLFE